MRRACRVLGRADEARLVADMVELARQYGRYGYRRIAAPLRDADWQVNAKRVERLTLRTNRGPVRPAGADGGHG